MAFEIKSETVLADHEKVSVVFVSENVVNETFKRCWQIYYISTSLLRWFSKYCEHHADNE